MAFWLVDRLLPGVISGLIVAAAVSVSHARLRRHITDVTDEQTERLERDQEAR